MEFREYILCSAKTGDSGAGLVAARALLRICSGQMTEEPAGWQALEELGLGDRKSCRGCWYNYENAVNREIALYVRAGLELPERLRKRRKS